MFGTGEGPLGYELLSETCSVQERGFWGTNRTPKRVRYRRRVSGVRTALETCLVQEMGLWGTNRTPKRVRYRRGASGVRTTLRNMCGTGEGPLGYELLSGTCVVQERSLWGTNRTPKRVRYRRWAFWGTNYTLEHVWYRRGASDVRNAPQNTLGIGKWAIVYRINEKRIPVQGLNFIRLTITILTEIFDNYEELQ